MPVCSHRRRPPNGDEGVTIVVAVMVSMVALTLSLLVAQIAMTINRESGVDRQRTVAVSAAEAGIDAATAAIVAGGATPPCSWTSAGTPYLYSYPDRTTVSASIAYYDGTGAALTCPAGGTLTSGTAAKAAITSTASTQPLAGGTTRGVRTMKAVVDLTAARSPWLGRAIFSDAPLQFDNSLTLDGVDPDVYTNSDATCINSLHIFGNLYAQGGINLGNSCDVDGDVHAKGNVSTNNSANLGGAVKSSQGNVSLSLATNVTGDIYAKGTTTWAKYPQCGKCHPYSTLDPPPGEQFPVLTWDSAAQATWAAASYTNVVTKENCTNANAADNPRRWVVDNASTLPAKTVLVTHCRIDWGNSTTLTLSNDLAIVSFGGIVNTNSFTVSATAATPTGTSRSFYWIIPNNAVTARPCTNVTTSTGSSLSTGNSFVVSPNVSMLFYSPCDVTLSNRTDLYGQVYSGSSVKVTNSFHMYYRPQPLWGATRDTGAVVSYAATISRKYESP